MRIAVVGGTGTVGRLVVSSAERAGVEPVVIARSRGIDVVTGAGLAEALAGSDAVIDVNNIATLRRTTAVRHFRAAGQQTARAERSAGVAHHVCLSIIGCDRVDLGYYAGKLVQESVAITSGIPWTILRAAQFFEFGGQILDRGKGPVLPVPRIRTQPVAAAEVAEELVRLALAGPAAMSPELAGPEVMNLADLIRKVGRELGNTRRIMEFALPGVTGAALATGALLPALAGPRGQMDIESWLESGAARRE